MSDKEYQHTCFLLALSIPPAFFLMVFLSDEPFSLLNGTSMWPAEFLKVLALWLSYFLLRHGENMVAESREYIRSELKLDKEAIAENNGIQNLWQQYQKADVSSVRGWRVWPVAAAWMILCVAIYYIQTPNIPFRGYWVFHIDWMLTTLTFAGFVILFASVSEATMHCRRFIQQLIDRDTLWPFMLKVDDQDVKSRLQKVQREWHEIKLIGMLTDSVSRTVYYPIYVILLLLAAQSDYFDNFDMPASLMLIASLNVFLVLCFSISLRRKAIEARDVSLDKIREIEEEIFLDDGHYGHKQKKRTLAKLRLYEKKIQDIREGAFLPIGEQPWLRALTLMTGGGSSLLLLQYLAS
ncbi:MAG: hypothetical protein ACE5DN_00475 [Flavobacteriales bacterium]